MLTSAHPILVINNGSSSLRFSVLDPKSETLLSSGLAERIGTEQGSLKMTDLDQQKHQEKIALADHRSALLRVIEILSENGQFECKAIGHRIVHGGEYFSDPVLVTDWRSSENRGTRRLSATPQPRERARYSGRFRAFPGQTASGRL